MLLRQASFGLGCALLFGEIGFAGVATWLVGLGWGAFVMVVVLGVGWGACVGLVACCKLSVLRLDSAFKMIALEALSSAVARLLLRVGEKEAAMELWKKWCRCCDSSSASIASYTVWIC